MFVKPIRERAHFFPEFVATIWHDDSSCELGLQRSDHAFNDRDATVLADSPIAWRLNTLSFYPTAKRYAVNDLITIAHDILWRCLVAADRSTKECL